MCLSSVMNVLCTLSVIRLSVTVEERRDKKWTTHDNGVNIETLLHMCVYVLEKYIFYILTYASCVS